MEPSIVDEIIDEIIDACVDDDAIIVVPNPSEHSIDSSCEHRSDVEFRHQSGAVESPDNVNDHEGDGVGLEEDLEIDRANETTDIVGCISDNPIIIGTHPNKHPIDSRLEDIEFCDQTDTAENPDSVNEHDENGTGFDDDLIDQLDDLEIDQANETCDVSAAAVHDINSNCKLIIEPEEKGMNVDRSRSDSLRLKGFSTRIISGRVRAVVNLSLMAVASQLSEYEIQCQRFPVQMLEDELVPIFEKFGQVYKLVKLIDSNTVLVTYTNLEDADKAVASLHCTQIQGHRVKVFNSIPNGRIIVRNIPYSAKKQELFEKFSRTTFDLQSVKVFNDSQDESKNRGFCYLDYGSHDKASSAIKMLHSKTMFGRPLIAEWPSRRFTCPKRSDTLYISNLRSSLRYDNFRKLFSKYGELMSVKLTGSFGVVRFQYTEDAMRAAREIDRSQLGNENIDISLAELTKDRKQYIRYPLPRPPQREIAQPTHALNNNANINHNQPPPIRPLSSSPGTLYISNVSSNLSSKDLRKAFSLFGDVSEIDKNENFASVQFQNPEQAKRAARLINKDQLGYDVHISFDKQPEKMRPVDMLYLKNLRSDIDTSDLRKYFSVYGEVMDIDKTGDSAAVHFRDSEIAKHAARAIDRRLLGVNVYISIDQQEAANREQRPMVSDTLYINNLYADMDVRGLRKIFSGYGVIDVDKSGNRASVRFSNADQSKRAAHEVNPIKLGKGNVEISLFPTLNGHFYG